MYTGKSLNNKALVSIKDGRKFGEIKDLYLDQDARDAVPVLPGGCGPEPAAVPQHAGPEIKDAIGAPEQPGVEVPLITGVGESLAGYLLTWDAKYMDWRKLKLPKNPDCIC